MSRRKQTALVYFVGQQRVSNARRHLESGEKMNALALLAKAWPVMFSRRWLGTLLMTIAIPRGLVRRWNQWRYLRKAIHG
jgi:hypothetical protein